MVFERFTLAAKTIFSGPGLHSGRPVRVTVHPADGGIVFRDGATRIPARPDCVSETRRCTCLGSIAVVEHLMSAFAGLGITDAEVEVEGNELPALDGSSLPYVEEFEAVGRTSLGTVRLVGPFARIYEKGELGEIALSSGCGWWRYTFVTSDRWPGVQEFEIQLDESRYREEVAPARTFAFSEEVPSLRAAGLGRGLDSDSALILGPDGYANSARFPDEPARHKLLDLVGDLYLAGVPCALLNVVAERSGHTAHVSAARKLAASVRFVEA